MDLAHLPHLPFTVLDTETTGFIPRVNRIIEFASVRYRDGKEEDMYEKLIAIPNEIPETVQVITRIRNADLDGKPSFDDVRTEIEEHIGSDTLIVGQNVGFDIRMLKGEGIDLSDRPWIDTSMLASLVFPELKSYSLGYVSTILGLSHEPVHRALGDVHATLQLLSKCMERIAELPTDMLKAMKETLAKSSPGYAMLSSALPKAKKGERPTFLQMPQSLIPETSPVALTLEKPALGTPGIIDDPLDPAFLQSVIDAVAADEATTHWIAVKNLRASQRRLRIDDRVRVLEPPFQLLDPQTAHALSSQEALTSDEATLLLKLEWYAPQTYSDLPIHGDEKAVWNGKIACTEESAAYRVQFENLPSVMLLDHWQLLALLADPNHPGHDALTADAHVIIDDASMLEDTATKAYGHYCPLDDIRAASEGDDDLTKFTDIVQLWIEKVRNFQDLRYIVPADLQTQEVQGLREHLEVLLARNDLAQLARNRLTDLAAILDPNSIDNSFSWIEIRQNGSQFLQSAPERIGPLLKKNLYDRIPTTLVMPPSMSEQLQEIVPTGTETAQSPLDIGEHPLPLAFPEDVSIASLLQNPPQGKTVVLLSSRRLIEEQFIRFTEELEAKGVTLLCQGFSGGQNRMQAEFLAAKVPCVWLLTPWTFEGIELPQESIDHLILDRLPFDHPSHAVIGRRAEHYQNAFMGYSLPRLKARLFRLLRTYTRMRKFEGDVAVLDDRLRAKDYGREVKGYLERVGE